MTATILLTVFSNLEEIDKSLFLFINSLHSSFFDFVMYYASERWVWIPFYLFLIFSLLSKHSDICARQKNR